MCTKTKALFNNSTIYKWKGIVVSQATCSCPTYLVGGLIYLHVNDVFLMMLMMLSFSYTHNAQKVVQTCRKMAHYNTLLYDYAVDKSSL